MSGTVNAIKDGYLKAVQWVADHPHKTLWGTGAYVVGSLVALVF